LRKSILIFGVIALLLSVAGVAHAQSPSAAVADLAVRINRERVSRGLPPYALNAQLTKAAQAHADDIAGTGNYSHTGSDGSTVFDRVARTGYGAYSWGRRLGENWAWYHDAATAMTMWMESQPHRDNILHTLYREMGIGIAPSRGNTIFVVDFGVQPNVVPVFIDDGAAETRALAVTLTLTSEDVMPNGDGADTIGRATLLQVSNAPNFAGARWQTFVPHLSWTLTPGAGIKNVYVKYRDAKGRTATASDSINFIAPVTATPRPSATITRTPRPTGTETFTPTLPPSDTPTLAPTDTAMPDATPTLTETVSLVTPAPTASPALESVDAPMAQDVDPIALGGFGVAVMLVIFGTVKYLADRPE
jgi:hypothetical protein